MEWWEQTGTKWTTELTASVFIATGSLTGYYWTFCRKHNWTTNYKKLWGKTGKKPSKTLRITTITWCKKTKNLLKRNNKSLRTPLQTNQSNLRILQPITCTRILKAWLRNKWMKKWMTVILRKKIVFQSQPWVRALFRIRSWWELYLRTIFRAVKCRVQQSMLKHPRLTPKR